MKNFLKGKALFSLICLILILIPSAIFADGEGIEFSKIKVPANEEKTIFLHWDDGQKAIVLDGNGFIDQGTYWGRYLDELTDAISQKMSDLNYSEGEIDSFLETSGLDGTGINFVIGSGIRLPDNCSALFSRNTSEIILKSIKFPKGLDTSNVTSMSFMFAFQEEISDLNLNDWDTSNITDMSGVFYGCFKVKPIVTNWNTSKVTTMAGLFLQAYEADPDVSKWNTSKVESMQGMFSNAKSAKPDVSKWDTSKLVDIAFMFDGAESADPDVSNWIINNNNDFFQNVFKNSGASGLDLRKWDFSSVKEKDHSYASAYFIYEMKKLQYFYLPAYHIFDYDYHGNYTNPMPEDFKMQKDGEKSSSVIVGSHNQYTFPQTGIPTVYFIPQKVNVAIQWKDQDNKNGFRPEEKEVKLQANGEDIGGTINIPPEDNPVTLKEVNNWTGSFSDLDIFSNGKKIDYTVYQDDIDDYITDFYFKKEGSVLYSSQMGKINEQKDGFTIVNTYMTIAEEIPLGTKPRVPKNFVKVSVDMTDKAEEPIKRVFWVTPNIEVELPVDEPIGRTDESKRVRYIFDHWQETKPLDRKWNKGEKIKAQFKEETEIEARYIEEAIEDIAPMKEKEYIPTFPVIAKVEKESKEHYKYLFGYPDDTFKPEGKITRAEAAAVIARLTNYFGDRDDSKPNFKDTPSAWYNMGINAVVKKNLMFADKYGNFRPNEPITRGELARAIQFIDKKNNAVAPFEDVKGHEFEEAINQAYGNQRIMGYPDGKFKPDAPLTRAEATVMLNKLYDREVKSEGLEAVKANIINYKDVDKNHWAYYEIMEASHSHKYTRKVSGELEEIWEKII